MKHKTTLKSAQPHDQDDNRRSRPAGPYVIVLAQCHVGGVFLPPLGEALYRWMAGTRKRSSLF